MTQQLDPPQCVDCEAVITEDYEAFMKRIYGDSLKIDLCDDCELARSLAIWDLQHGK